jgi:hypothetical protein
VRIRFPPTRIPNEARGDGTGEETEWMSVLSRSRTTSVPWAAMASKKVLKSARRALPYLRGSRGSRGGLLGIVY